MAVQGLMPLWVEQVSLYHSETDRASLPRVPPCRRRCCPRGSIFRVPLVTPTVCDGKADCPWLVNRGDDRWSIGLGDVRIQVFSLCWTLGLKHYSGFTGLQFYRYDESCYRRFLTSLMAIFRRTCIMFVIQVILWGRSFWSVIPNTYTLIPHLTGHSYM